jgi:aromatic ring hydroxylase
MVRHLHDIAGGGVITTPSMADLDNPDTGAQLRKYLTGAADVDGEVRAKLFHAIRDSTADAYGGWHPVTNVQSGRRTVRPAVGDAQVLGHGPGEADGQARRGARRGCGD